MSNTIPLFFNSFLLLLFSGFIPRWLDVLREFRSAPDNDRDEGSLTLDLFSNSRFQRRTGRLQIASNFDREAILQSLVDHFEVSGLGLRSWRTTAEGRIALA
jgi:hypothetical protein